ncbi:MAG: metallophosphoesterase [Clostridia bacterium]|nr:metallophosphoesterase [Clostridia bacterium]
MTYVISNIHGDYKKFKEILSQISFKERDTLYILGDLLDYGEESMELIGDLSVRLNVFCIAGEHDYLAARMLKGFSAMLESGAAPSEDYIAEMTAWVQDGGQPTLEAFRALDKDAREGVIEYLEEMTLFEEVEIKGTRYLLVHAGIADYSPDADLEDYLPEDFFSEPLDASYPLVEDVTVVVGHVPTRSGKIERGEGSIFLDCGVCEGGRLGCLCLETGEEFYA